MAIDLFQNPGPPVNQNDPDGIVLLSDLMNRHDNPIQFTENINGTYNIERVDVQIQGRLVIDVPVEKICGVTFNGQSGLKEIIFSDDATANALKQIGGGAFLGCENLEQVRLPASLEKIGNGVFAGCDKLDSMSVHYQGTEEQWQRLIENSNRLTRDNDGFDTQRWNENAEQIRQPRFGAEISIETIVNSHEARMQEIESEIRRQSTIDLGNKMQDLAMEQTSQKDATDEKQVRNLDNVVEQMNAKVVEREEEMRRGVQVQETALNDLGQKSIETTEANQKPSQSIQELLEKAHAIEDESINTKLSSREQVAKAGEELANHIEEKHVKQEADKTLDFDLF